jgi:hypothetical protein
MFENIQGRIVSAAASRRSDESADWLDVVASLCLGSNLRMKAADQRPQPRLHIQENRE